ncbi:MAG TPA: alkaline phosphatase family protein [Burkholderiaceae bacterium]|nr:alkaline phosphatase family protein [Burkholderiaceae bacterium]
MRNLKITIALALGVAFAAAPAVARDHADAKIPRLDHVFVIVMENHYFHQIYGNTNAPFVTSYANSANLAANYFGVGHPSLTNYLEIVGGSNFGVVNDNSPDWHNSACKSNLETNTPALEGAPNICPIAGSGMDAATPAVDTTNEGSPGAPIYNDPIAPAFTVGRTIADQLVEAGLSWKSYQQSLPPYGADKVNNSDGMISNLTTAVAGMPLLYAVKHNPFVYFASVQGGDDGSGLANVAGFEQLYADLRAGAVPNYSFIVPDQCHDQHGRGSSEVGPYCSTDSLSIQAGDVAVQNLVGAIHASDAWKHGRNAIVVVWDENDYSSLPNQVVTIVDTNYGVSKTTSNVKYNHFSLLKTIEAGFGLSYLNHAADHTVPLMSDLFAPADH